MRLKKQFITLNKETRLYGTQFPIIGLTGGIATGKSLATDILSDKGYHVICADTLVKQIYSKKTSFSFILKEFPEAIKNQSIDFKHLRALFFSSEKTKKKIEDFIYSQMPQEFELAVEKLNNPSYTFYDIPLLFEKKLETKVDMSLCIYTPYKLQKERLLKRDQINENLADEIIKAQIDIDKKKENATFSIDNSQSKESFVERLDDCLKKIFLTKN